MQKSVSSVCKLGEVFIQEKREAVSFPLLFLQPDVQTWCYDWRGHLRPPGNLGMDAMQWKKIVQGACVLDIVTPVWPWTVYFRLPCKREIKPYFCLSHYFGFCHSQLFLNLTNTDALEKITSKWFTDLEIFVLVLYKSHRILILTNKKW